MSDRSAVQPWPPEASAGARFGCASAAALFLVGLALIDGAAANETGARCVAPFETETEIWRDEQPGTDARLHVVVRLLLGHGAQPWSDVVSADVELRAEPKSWRPETKALRQTGQGGLELHAQGPATLPAGLSVVPVIELTTSTGTQRLVLDADVVQVVD